MGDNEFSQEMVFNTKYRWIVMILDLMLLIGIILFVWNEILFLTAGHPDNYSYSLLEWLWDEEMSRSKFRYYLIWYFPFMIFSQSYVLLFSFYSVLFNKLHVGDEGIEYSTLSFSSKILWKDVERIERSHFFFRPTERIFSKEKMIFKRKSGFPARLFANEPKCIPLDVFGKNASGISASKLVDRYMKKYGKVSLESEDTP